MVVENLQIELWNPRILSWMCLHSMFSRNDKLISWEDIARNAETVKERGMNARYELFDKSEHVAHIEPERYWSSVQEMISKGKGEDEKIYKCRL
jgi:hypothetical protein